MASVIIQPVRMSEEEKGLRQRYKDELPYFAQECLRIRPKSGELLPFRFNGVQSYVHGQLEAQKRASGKVRALILKARQEGVSTLIGARYYHQAIHRRGCQVFILTHEQDATNNLFGMVERFQKHNRPGLAPTVGASNAKELYFPRLDSGYSVGTAGSKAVGRSKTIQLFHGSEVAFWPNAKEHFAGVVQTVPDLPDTEIIFESTANGLGGEFADRWGQAQAGEGDYQAIFVPWFWSLDYQRPPPLDFEINEEEEDYARLYGLSVQQIVWRRAKLAELGDPSLFRAEYPANAAEAFQATGHDAFIPSQLILQARKRDCEAIGSLILGVDPARFGDDAFAIAWRRGRKVEKVERRYKLDTVQGANWVKQIIEQDSPARVFIDLGNMGAGVVDLLKDWGGAYEKLTEGVNFGGAPQNPHQVTGKGELVPGPRNRRAEMWMRSKAWLQDEGGADIPDLDSLQADAVAPGYRYDARQFLVLEGKEEIRNRGLRSPDGWDAVALTFAAPVKAVSEEDASGRPWRRKGRGGFASLWGA
jgi:hypothetical protein